MIERKNDSFYCYRPIIKNDLAKELGIEISLFERQAEIQDRIMLKEQYRMVGSQLFASSGSFKDNPAKCLLVFSTATSASFLQDGFTRECCVRTSRSS